MVRNHVEHLLTVLDSASPRKLDAEYCLHFGVVHFGTENKNRILLRVYDCPARKGARNFNNVLLCIAAIHTKGVKLHQLASVILIETGAASLRIALRLRSKKAPTSQLRTRAWIHVDRIPSAASILRT